MRGHPQEHVCPVTSILRVEFAAIHVAYHCCPQPGGSSQPRRSPCDNSEPHGENAAPQLNVRLPRHCHAAFRARRLRAIRSFRHRCCHWCLRLSFDVLMLPFRADSVHNIRHDTNTMSTSPQARVTHTTSPSFAQTMLNAHPRRPPYALLL